MEHYLYWSVVPHPPGPLGRTVRVRVELITPFSAQRGWWPTLEHLIDMLFVEQCALSPSDYVFPILLEMQKTILKGVPR